eukprot:TRINITY_DN4711_c0_g1_i1.p1 TRINITY_DN4711_c0_g1~~TRINITY_DN4711_c0_g1_i1.p1  ORF type:complete len:441 (+),score=105.81 TRINITY_DN4711_c0_g1_i1:91-1323(+)
MELDSPEKLDELIDTIVETENTDPERKVVKALMLLQKIARKEDKHELLYKKGLVKILVEKLSEWIVVEQFEDQTDKRNLTARVLSLFAEAETFQEKMIECGTVPVLVDIIGKLPASVERKNMIRCLCFLSENVFVRNHIPQYFEQSVDDVQAYITRIKDDPYDIDEKEFFVDILKNTEMTLEMYQPGKAWYDASQFAACKILEDNYHIIREEIEEYARLQMIAWPEKYLCKTGWDVLGMFAFENKIGINCEQCPKTAEILSQIDGMTTAMFSCLKPRTHIKPHIGYYQYSEKILRMHLGVIIPDGCVMKVNGEERTWEEGKCLLFDDTFRHEAWNANYEKTRIIMLVDIIFEGNVEDRNQEFFKDGMDNTLDSEALVSKYLLHALGSLGAETDNTKDRDTHATAMENVVP